MSDFTWSISDGGLRLIDGGDLVVVSGKDDYQAAVECNGLEDDDAGWVESGGAMLHTFQNSDGRLFFILDVASKYLDESDDVDLQGLLVHEAVHAFQYIRRDMLRSGIADAQALLATGTLGSEFEAYAIQNIYMAMVTKFERYREALK